MHLGIFQDKAFMELRNVTSVVERPFHAILAKRCMGAIGKDGREIKGRDVALIEDAVR